ncbi:hypothetical protein GCM10010869_57670 [Mesorhizobium tianshanense]|nr:hypothetical protein GCM10010869_57670 [Mesorhizobium tianshanense]
MRQRLLNGALAGALAALFCLLAATAYTEVRQDEAEARCTSEKPPSSGKRPGANLRGDDVRHRHDACAQLR